jgi:hypothetical protein
MKHPGQMKKHKAIDCHGTSSGKKSQADPLESSTGRPATEMMNPQNRNTTRYDVFCPDEY